MTGSQEGHEETPDREPARFPGRAAVLQRVVPPYRAAAFNELASRCEGGLVLLAGMPRSDENMALADDDESHVDRVELTNRYLSVRGGWFCWQANLRRELARHRPDVLIAEANPRCVSTPLAVNWMRRRGLPVLGWGLGTDAGTGPAGRIQAGIRRRFVRQFDAMIAYSTAGAHQYVQAGVAADQVTVAVNSSVSGASLMEKGEAKGGDRLRVVFVGRLEDRKRIDVLIRACAEASSTATSSPHLLIVGSGSARDGLEALASTVYPSTTFTGPLYGEELSDALKAADLMVLPGTGGLAVQEGMAHGLAVAVGDGDGTQHDLVGAENGWHVRPGDQAQLANVLTSAMENIPRVREMGRLSSTLVARRFNLETMVDGIVQAACSAAQRSVSK